MGGGAFVASYSNSFIQEEAIERVGSEILIYS